MSVATMSRPKRDSAKAASAKRAPRRKAECKSAQATGLGDQESPATPQTTGKPADIAGLFPIETHALNAADHELIETARKATETELQARALVGDAETDPPEAAALFDQATQAILHMSDIEAQTWDGFLARQIAVAVWTGEGRAPESGRPDVWSEYAGGRDAVRLLGAHAAISPLIRPAQPRGSDSHSGPSPFDTPSLLKWALDRASLRAMRAQEMILALTEAIEAHATDADESLAWQWHGVLCFAAQYLDETSSDADQAVRGGVK